MTTDYCAANAGRGGYSACNQPAHPLTVEAGLEPRCAEHFHRLTGQTPEQALGPLPRKEPDDRHCECGEEGTVGVGTPPTWLCLTHFQSWLQHVRKTWPV